MCLFNCLSDKIHFFIDDLSITTYSKIHKGVRIISRLYYFTDWYFFTCISFFLSNDIQLHRGAVGEAEEQH